MSGTGAEARTVRTGARFVATVRVPPSKSLTNRCLNLALLADREVLLRHPLESDDTVRLVEAAERLGFRVARLPGSWRLAPGELPSEATIECGLSGTMARFLTATLAVLPGHWRLDGGARLRERPIGPLVEALRGLGAEIEYLGPPGTLPLAIRGRELEGGATRLDASESSQYLSALLMAGSRTRRGLSVAVDALTSAPYVDLTLDTMRRFGLEVRARGREFLVQPARGSGGQFEIEGDYSAACYPAAAALLTRGRAELVGLAADSAQGDRRFFDLLDRMGASVSWQGDRLVVRGGGPLTAVDAGLEQMPDQVPTLAALAPFAAGTTRIRNVPHLRLKESDRLAAMGSELRRLGLAVREQADGLEIPGSWAAASPPSEPVSVDAHGDHRIAMSLALVGLRRPGVVIEGADAVAKSYPDFWRDLEAGLQD